MNGDKITFGCPVLDSVFSGGIPCKYLTEFVGESGIGKTQISLQLSLAVQLPPSHGGLSGSSLYLYTKGRFPSRRLTQLCQSFENRYGNLIRHSMENEVFIEEVDSVAEFLVMGSRIEAHLTYKSIEDMPCRLIIVDSVAGLFIEDLPRHLRPRDEVLCRISRQLKRWADMFNLAVVVINHVHDFIPSRHINPPGWEGLITSGRRVCTSLGFTWSCRLNTRLFMWKDTEGKRHIRTVLGSYFPDISCEFIITSDGVFSEDV